MFVPGRLFQPSLMFVGKDRSLKGASLGQAPTLLTNIRLGWKGLPGANTHNGLTRGLRRKSSVANTTLGAILEQIYLSCKLGHFRNSEQLYPQL